MEIKEKFIYPGDVFFRYKMSEFNSRGKEVAYIVFSFYGMPINANISYLNARQLGGSNKGFGSALWNEFALYIIMQGADTLSWYAISEGLAATYSKYSGTTGIVNPIVKTRN